MVQTSPEYVNFGYGKHAWCDYTQFLIDLFADNFSSNKETFFIIRVTSPEQQQQLGWAFGECATL